MAVLQVNLENGRATNGTAQAYHDSGDEYSQTGTLNGFGAHGESARAADAELLAICGMALRLPGGLSTPQQLWDFLISKGDARSRVPATRYNIDAHFSSKGQPGTVCTEYGYFLDDSVDLGAFDASFFNSHIRRAEAARMDPQQRLLLEVVREALEDAGEIDTSGRNIGCYVGTFGEDWVEMYAKESQNYGPYRPTAAGDYMMPNRISTDLDIHGPSILIRTACSSALVGLHEACLAIGRGECESAIVAGANLIMTPYMTTSMSEMHALSPDGSCKTFSADADGYGRAEAINAIFVKPLADAVRDGNPIRAVIRGTATNFDGRSVAAHASANAPNAVAQEALIRRAYEVAGIEDLSQTAFVECHGTGTAVGDPAETDAVAAVFGPSGGVYIGSAKPNLGHGEGASGLTSLIKSVLALENKTLPPNIKFNKPSPDIKWDAGLKVPTEPTEWPPDRQERISVNSFGIGGANAHAILDSASSFGFTRRAVSTETPQLLLFSGTSAESVKQMASDHNDFHMRNPDVSADLAYTLANRREHWAQRSYAVAKKYSAFTASPVVKAGAQEPKVVMVFTGQGAQWPRMGRELLLDPAYSTFKHTIGRLNKYLQAASFRPDWNIEEELLREPRDSRLSSAEFAQPLCTAVQVALVDMLSAIGVKAAAVIGHSSGELAAAYAAGALTAQEAIVLAFHRGSVSKLQSKAGAMAAVGMSREEVEEWLVPGVVVACENSPNSVTLSGDAPQVRAVVRNIKDADDDVLARLLKVDKAYHSHHMVEVGADYEALIEKEVKAKRTLKPFFSSVTGELLDPEFGLGAKYWRRNLESPVLFNSAVTNLLQHDRFRKDTLFVEIGPHAALAGPLRQIQSQTQTTAPYISILNRNTDCVESFLNAVGQLFCVNVGFDFEAVFAQGSTLKDLPRYPWHHSETYWYESRLSKDWRHRKFPYHDLLGLRLPESTDFNPVFRNLFHLSNSEWVKDHKVSGNVVFPFAGYVSMVGEGIRQIEGVEASFVLRHVVVSTALVLNEGKPTEIITSFRRHRLTDSLDSEWWEFTVATHNGHLWVQHCHGEAKAGPADPQTGQPPPFAPRSVSFVRCYDTMQRAGLEFGPTFRSLRDVRSGTLRQVATAKASNGMSDRSLHHLHPTLIDAAIQLLTVAATQGFTSQTELQLHVPTVVDELTVFRSSSEIDIVSSANSFTSRGVTGLSIGMANGKVVLELRGLHLTPVDQGDSKETENEPAHIQWGPHVDFTDISSLAQSNRDMAYAQVWDDLSRVCMEGTMRKVQGLKAGKSHLQKYILWIERQLADCKELTQHFWHAHAQKPCPSVVLADLSDDEIAAKIDELVNKCAGTTASPHCVLIRNIYQNIVPIMTGEIDPLQVFMMDDSLPQTYDFNAATDRSPLYRRIAFSKPNLRILEIGAETGAQTAKVIEALTLANGRRMFSEYVYTDISAGLFSGAKERFSHVPNIEYALLDISKSVSDQGFGRRKFDLIIASNVIHATRSLHESLVNVRQLLAPGGRFCMVEFITPSRWSNYVWGTLPGWWLGEDDGRPDEPYVKPARWDAELRAAGFDGIEACILDAEEPANQCATIISKSKSDAVASNKVTLLCENPDKPGPVYDELKRRGYAVDKMTLSNAPFPVSQDIISVVDLGTPFFENVGETQFEDLKRALTQLRGSGMFWLTRPSQMGCTDPRYSQCLGLARTLRHEMNLEFAVCEVDDIGESADLVADVFTKFQLREEDDAFKPEFEYAISGRTVNVPRAFPFDISEALQVTDRNDATVLRTSKAGRLDNLHWTKKATIALQHDDVEIKPYAGGLNFKDLLHAAGILAPVTADYGLEGSGVISRVGPDATDLKVGDRVIFFSRGAFASHMTCPESNCAKMPDDMTFEQGATMPTVYSTSIYSLLELGGLKKGQSVLIHSGAGGVGIAAIQVAKMVGAEVFATVGNDEKVKHLMKTFGLPRNRIFHSRDTSFVEGILRETGGEGVDVALNSLSGEMLHATWKCIAKYGRMVEIGKRDMLGAAKLDMMPFLANRSYACFDLDAFGTDRPAVLKRLLASAIELYKAGHIKPISPVKVIPAGQAVEAFRLIQQGQHIGKIVIRIRNHAGDLDPELDAETDVRRREGELVLDGSGFYLLVGGLGGLGRCIASWMVEKGARNLIFLSRSAADSDQHKDFLEEIQSMGAKAVMIPGSVAVASDVQAAVKAAQGKLKGVMQLSMVLRDQAFSKMTMAEWSAAVVPKVQGTWNLHNATLGEPLDFFLMFGSLSGVAGNAGQSNYASGNTFLDAFAQYRASLGLPGSVIDLGHVQEVGFVAANEMHAQRMRGNASLKPITRTGMLKCLAACMTCSSTDTDDPVDSCATFAFRRGVVLGLETAVPLDRPESRAVWKKDIRMAMYHNDARASETTADSGSDALRNLVNRVRHDPDALKARDTATFIAGKIGKRLNVFLLRPEDEEVDITRSLADLGMDSLVATELRSWWKSIFDFNITILEMMNMGSLEALGKHATDTLLRLHLGE